MLQISAPTLVTLREPDRGIHMCHRLKLYNHLKSRGVATRCNVYDDSHALDKPAYDVDCFVNTVLWFKKHISSSSSS